MPAEVEVFEVKPQTEKRYLNATGTLESPQTTELTSETDGKIIYLNIPEGKTVTKGSVLARINDSSVLAEIKINEAKLKNAQENYNRMKSLREKGAISQQTLDNALEVLEVAEGESEYTASNQTMTTVEAPFSGILSLRKVSLGEYIQAGDLIVRISQIDPLHLIFSIPEQSANEIHENQEIKFTVNNSSKEYTGKVSAIDPYIDPQTRFINIKAVVPNQNKELLPGKFASVKIETHKTDNAISVPQEALIEEGNKKQIAIADAENMVLFKEVIVDQWNNGSITISKGLMAGDKVITSGYQKVQPGFTVIPKSYSPIHNKILDKEAH